MNRSEDFSRAVSYIETHLGEKPDYTVIAAQAFSSVYHFQRVFSILAGCTLGEYIRARRMSLAGAALAADKCRVLDTALKYGYDSPDSFAKAFQKFHGILPSDARTEGARLKYFPRLCITETKGNTKTMDFRIENKPELILTGFKRRFSGVPGERREQEIDFYTHTRALQYMLNGMSSHPETMYNVTMNISDDGFDFWIAQALSSKIRERMHEDCVLGDPYANAYENLVIPARTYAVFETERCIYPTECFLGLRRRIVTEWLPDSRMQFADAPEITVSHWYPAPHKEERYYELWIPVEPIKQEVCPTIG